MRASSNPYAGFDTTPLPQPYADMGNRRARRQPGAETPTAQRRAPLSAAARYELGRARAISALRPPSAEPLPASTPAASWIQPFVDALSAPLSWLHEATRFPGADAQAVRATPQPDFLKDLIAVLRADAELQKVFLTEAHGQSGNAPMVAQTLLGALKDGRVTLYRETNPTVDPELLEHVLATPATRSYAEKHMLGCVVANPELEDTAAAQLLKRVLAHEGVQFKPLRFYRGAEHNDLKRFADDPEFAVASLGISHALCRHLDDLKLKVPWLGIIENPVDDFKALSPSAKKATFGGFDRARRKANTIFVLQSQLWLTESPNTRENLTAHYNGQGYAVMEIPLDKGINATIFAPASALPVLNRFARQHNGKVSLHCTGIPGCEEPVAKEEL